MKILEPLLSLRATRVVARPGWVCVSLPEGERVVDIAWTEAQHAEALAALPVDLDDGSVVCTIAGEIIIRRPIDATLDALVQQSWLSMMAARMLSRAANLGCNILVVGPEAVALPLLTALVNEGQRPAVLGEFISSWPRLQTLDEVRVYGPDRLAVLGESVAGALIACTNVCAYLDARRLDQALMRLEILFERSQARSVPLHVLAGLDLLVVVSQVGRPHVQQVCEMALASEGYRPHLLFTTGVAPIKTALVPVGVPSFIEDLDPVLANEMRAASSAPAPAPAQTRTRISSPDVVAPPVVAQQIIVEDADAPPPGWELDQITEDLTSSEGIQTAEDAMMAATYGLAPPPRPTEKK